MSAAGAATVPRELTSWWLVGAAALSPTAWLAHIAAMPALVPLSCSTGHTWPMHVTTAVTAVVAAMGVLALLRTRSTLRVAQGPDDEQELILRARAWSCWGLFVGVLFLVLILAEHVPVLLLSACPP